MSLSDEAIISLVGVIVNLPAALLILFKLWMYRRQEGADETANESGWSWNFILFFFPQPLNLSSPGTPPTFVSVYQSCIL
jgi:hypothetical protein